MRRSKTGLREPGCSLRCVGRLIAGCGPVSGLASAGLRLPAMGRDGDDWVARGSGRPRSGRLPVERLRRDVGAVGPHDCPLGRVDTDLREETWVVA